MVSFSVTVYRTLLKEYHSGPVGLRADLGSLKRLEIRHWLTRKVLDNKYWANFVFDFLFSVGPEGLGEKTFKIRT